jgi:hypothetical protein
MMAGSAAWELELIRGTITLGGVIAQNFGCQGLYAVAQTNIEALLATAHPDDDTDGKIRLRQV